MQQLLCRECMKHLEASSVCPSAGINLEVIDMKYYNMSGHGCIYLLKDNKYENSDCCTLTALRSVEQKTGIFSDRCCFNFDRFECTQ